MAAGIFKPMYLLGPSIILLVAIPLAIFAAVTTSLAIFALTFRASLVYIELATAIVQSWLFKTPKKSIERKPDFAHLTPTATPATAPINPARHRRYPSSAVASSNASSQDLTVPKKPLSRRESWNSIVGPGSEHRDYEGIGGWRITGEAEDDALWIGMNSRLELPAALERQRKHHTRSLTSTSQRFSGSPEMRMSPMQSRARTPSAAATSLDLPQTQEYFDLQPHGKQLESQSASIIGKVKEMARRKSLSANSTGSSSSGRVSKTAVKRTSYG